LLEAFKTGGYFGPKTKAGRDMRNQTIKEIINARYGLQRAALKEVSGLY
jgi:hypothetical protein